MVKYLWCFWIRENTLIKNFGKKIKKVKIIKAENVNDTFINILENIDCLIIDNFENNIEQKFFILYSINLNN